MDAARRASFPQRFFRLAGAWWSGEDRWRVRGLTAVMVIMTVCQVGVQVLVNRWSARLFDALEARQIGQFAMLFGLLCLIILTNMAVIACQVRSKRALQVGWRRWLTDHVVQEWMAGGRQYQVSLLPGDHDNPDGRIAEDVRNATESALDLAQSLIYCLLLLFSFTQVLWSLSGNPAVQVLGVTVVVHGYLVWIALLYALCGSGIALLLGRPLVRSANLRQTREADFRFGLALARENAEAIALVKGEGRERRLVTGLFGGIREAWVAQTRALTNIYVFSAGYSVLSTGFPVLVVAPRYMAGMISLGVLMQTVQAFQQMASALAWPIDNLSSASGWKASAERVLGLWEAVETLKQEVARHAEDQSIVLEPGTEPLLGFSDLSVIDPDGTPVVDRFSAEIRLGEHVLISGDAAAAVKLFKVVAGLWPWGRGRVTLPGGADVFFMPERPYLPTASLRTSLSYPSEATTFTPEALAEALTKVELPDLIHRLSEVADWHNQLGVGDQQRLGFARLLLHRPNWIFIQEATDALTAEAEEAMMRLLGTEFPQAAVLTVGFHPALERFHQRRLDLERPGSGNGPAHLRDHPAAPPMALSPASKQMQDWLAARAKVMRKWRR